MNVLQPKKTCNFFGLVLHTAMPLPITVCCSDVARGVVPVGAGGAMVPPDFCRSVKPIGNLNQGGQIMPTK